jgi:hypothetical protein
LPPKSQEILNSREIREAEQNNADICNNATTKNIYNSKLRTVERLSNAEPLGQVVFALQIGRAKSADLLMGLWLVKLPMSWEFS